MEGPTRNEQRRWLRRRHWQKGGARIRPLPPVPQSARAAAARSTNKGPGREDCCCCLPAMEGPTRNERAAVAAQKALAKGGSSYTTSSSSASVRQGRRRSLNKQGPWPGGLLLLSPGHGMAHQKRAAVAAQKALAKGGSSYTTSSSS